MLNRLGYISLLIVLGQLMLGMACSRETEMDISGWKLVWHDEFDGPAGAPPDPARWVHDIGTDWGNKQLEFDTDQPANAATDGGGNLRIVARQEAYEDRNFTSARLKTQGLFEPTYGRFEARMKLPTGQGIWPAFWLLGSNIESAGWPGCGEIDIMEYRGQEPSVIHGTLHGPGYSGHHPIGTRVTRPELRFSEAYHVFAVEWEKDNIRWYLDGELYQDLSPRDVPGDWVFDHPFHIILNLAVGGGWVGPPNTETRFPQTLYIDYVRIYQRAG